MTFRRIEGSELMEILSAKAYRAYSYADPIAVWTDGQTYTINDNRAKITTYSLIAEKLTAEDVCDYFEALEDDQNG